MNASEISTLRWPEDKASIAQLTLEWKQWWLGTQEPKWMAEVSETSEFRWFWRVYFFWPLKLKRLGLYILKPWLLVRKKDVKAEAGLLARIAERRKAKT